MMKSKNEDNKEIFSIFFFLGFLKLLDEAGSEIGSVLSFGDSFLRRDVEEGRLCYEGTGGVGVNTFSIREDSFSYSVGEGQFKRFGEVTIRVEDFTLSSTQDRSLPGSEVESTGDTEFEPDSSSNERGASQSAVLGSPIVASFNRRPVSIETFKSQFSKISNLKFGKIVFIISLFYFLNEERRRKNRLQHVFILHQLFTFFTNFKMQTRTNDIF